MQFIYRIDRSPARRDVALRDFTVVALSAEIISDKIVAASQVNKKGPTLEYA